jgi:hypothetical protein
MMYKYVLEYFQLVCFVIPVMVRTSIGMYYLHPFVIPVMVRTSIGMYYLHPPKYLPF